MSVDQPKLDSIAVGDIATSALIPENALQNMSPGAIQSIQMKARINNDREGNQVSEVVAAANVSERDLGNMTPPSTSKPLPAQGKNLPGL